MQFLEQQMVEWEQPDLAAFLKKEGESVESMTDISTIITAFVNKVGKKVVLLIDEVDKSTNNQLFMDLLGILRHKYLKRHLKTEATFQSVVLVGVQDIKTLKLKIRPETKSAPYDSPWNIATDFKVNMNFQPGEMVPMLEEYAKERDVKLNAVLLADRLFYLTSGYPFLVSGIYKVFDEEILPDKEEKRWTEEDLNRAAHLFVTSPYSNTNFDHLIKNLENYPELYQLVFDILMTERHFDFNIQDPMVNLGVLYGIFDYERGNGLKIHNRIYSELIFNYMTSKIKRQTKFADYHAQEDYLLPNNRLDLQKVLDKFQRFMIEQASDKNREFLERNGTLLFLGFLQPIINGGGYAFKEPQISNEKRLDVVITFYQYKYVIELKIWRGESHHEKGLAQLADYLNRQHLDEGWLLIFDLRKKEKSGDKKWLKEKGKKIYAVWV